MQEGQQAVVTSFGRYSHTVDAGFHWRLPYPIQAHETVNVTQLRSAEVGRNTVVAGDRPARLVDADPGREHRRHPLHRAVPAEGRARLPVREPRPEEAVMQAAESAVREIVGKSKMDSVLYEQRDAIAADSCKSIQASSTAKAGIVIVNVNVAERAAARAGAGGVRRRAQGRPGRATAPKNEGQAYANDVIPRRRARRRA